MLKQRDVFLQSEGDAWFERNHDNVKAKSLDENQPVLSAVLKCYNVEAVQSESVKLLEIGCGEGKRLGWLSENCKINCFGLDPSEKAVEGALLNGVNAVKGTADQLPFENQTFNIVLFGFCLYLCDRTDLFRIAYEADRVLKSNGWIIIHDFFSPQYYRTKYHHYEGIYSHKMDYKSLFEWHPAYTCFSHEITHHSKSVYTDDREEWTAISVLRKDTINV
jgi:ubiquinone/menaquinone biosynthesis C-methylase UbiE